MVFLYLQFTCPPEALEAVTGAVTKTQAYDEMVSSEWIHRARDNESDVVALEFEFLFSNNYLSHH